MTNSEIADGLDEIKTRIEVLKNTLYNQYKDKEYYLSQFHHETVVRKLDIVKWILDL